MPTVVTPVYWSFRTLANVLLLRELFCERHAGKRAAATRVVLRTVAALLRRPV